MPAERGPSGTGHDTAGCERHKGDPHNLCEECWKVEPPPVAVPGPASEPICPGCKRPVSECQAEDVYEIVDAPGPASVSPADTIRRAFVRPVEGEDGTYEWDAETDEELLAAPAALDALLAVGERDKAEIEESHAFLAAAQRVALRDRQRIARLTEQVERLLDCRGATNGTVSKRGGEPAVCRECAEAARAVLADEEDAE